MQLQDYTYVYMYALGEGRERLLFIIILLKMFRTQYFSFFWVQEKTKIGTSIL